MDFESQLLKQQEGQHDRMTPTYPMLGVSPYSVQRLLREDIKPTISPALLSVVEQLSQHEGVPSSPMAYTTGVILPTMHASNSDSMLMAGSSKGDDCKAVTPPFLMLDHHQQHMNAAGHQNRLLLNPPIEMEQVVYPSMASQHSQGVPSPTDSSSSSRPFFCNECGKSFQNNSALVKHKLIHSDERHHVCHVCHKAFKRQDHLTGHMNVHKSVKPFRCVMKDCDKSYCDARSLRRHLEHGHNMRNASVHSLKGTMYIRCGDGEEISVPMASGTAAQQNDSGDLSGHRERSSSGETSSTLSVRDLSPSSGLYGSCNLGLLQQHDKGVAVECNQCGRSFKNVPALNGHMRLHSTANRGDLRMPGVGSPGHPQLLAPPSHQLSSSPSPLGGNHSPYLRQYNHQSVPPSLIGGGSGFMPSAAQSAPVTPSSMADAHHQRLLFGPHSFTGVQLPHHQSRLFDTFVTSSAVTVQADRHGDYQELLQSQQHALQQQALQHQQQLALQQQLDHHDPVNSVISLLDTSGDDLASTSAMLSSAQQVSQPNTPQNVGHPNAEQRQVHDLGDMLNFSQVDDETIQKELAQLTFPDLHDAGYDQSHSQHRQGQQGDGGGIETTLGPLAIDTNTDQLFSSLALPERRRHKTDPGFIHHRMNSLAASQGPSSSNTSHIQEPSPSSSMTHSNPLRMRRRSKGKPENVCQLLTSISHNPSFSITRRHNSFSGHHSSMRKQSSMGQKRQRSGSKGHRNRSISISIAEYQGRKRKPTIITLARFPSQLRSPRIFDGPLIGAAAPPYTPPPILSPMRNGSGLFWQLSRALGLPPGQLPADLVSGLQRAITVDASELQSGPIRRKISIDTGGLLQRIQDESDQMNIVDVEAMSRKDSSASTMSAKSLSYLADSSSANAHDCDQLPSRKMSSVSVDCGNLRKMSTISDCYYDYTPPETDATPHINLGRQFQAQVKRWDDRSASQRELDSISERAELVFNPRLIEGIPEATVEAYEDLACSCAAPIPGKNKELALHLLMEQKGNIREALRQLMQIDKIDLKKYPSIRNSKYVDADFWTADEVQSFQDAIYKSEKDFHSVAQDMKTKSVKQCISFYYTWKKACPDDYRKLRNLRRKRQLLEMHQQAAASAESYNLRSTNPRNFNEDSDGSMSDGVGDLDDFPAPALNAALNGHLESPIADESRASKVARANQSDSPAPPRRKTSTIRFSEPTPIDHSPSPRPSSRGFQNRPKKGAQPAADGYFHCRLCDKCFEKVKSLNAHMKSHAMKARAAAEAAASGR
uniref:Uncharacterized protein n=1 Tax=Plectus sambesii TaxID=2011161 RepID=A0A914WWM8_9BILA